MAKARRKRSTSQPPPADPPPSRKLIDKLSPLAEDGRILENDIVEFRGEFGVSPYRRAIEIWKARGRPAASRRTSSTVDVLALRHPSNGTVVTVP
jgi:hypothetical protein